MGSIAELYKSITGMPEMPDLRLHEPKQSSGFENVITWLRQNRGFMEDAIRFYVSGNTDLYDCEVKTTQIEGVYQGEIKRVTINKDGSTEEISIGIISERYYDGKLFQRKIYLTLEDEDLGLVSIREFNENGEIIKITESWRYKTDSEIWERSSVDRSEIIRTR